MLKQKRKAPKIEYTFPSCISILSKNVVNNSHTVLEKYPGPPDVIHYEKVYWPLAIFAMLTWHILLEKKKEEYIMPSSIYAYKKKKLHYSQVYRLTQTQIQYNIIIRHDVAKLNCTSSIKKKKESCISIQSCKKNII